MADISNNFSTESKAALRSGANGTAVDTGRLPHYLPPDLIGGSLPHIQGMEDEAVWNAASQACATDRVHYVYTLEASRIWYLATPSASLASNPDTWCPLAAALPGNSEFWDKETVYLFDQEGTAAGLRWDQETGKMQVFVGPSRTILPRLQTLDANFVTIDAGRADVAPWKNRALMQEKLSRAAVRGLFWTGTSVAAVSLVIWLLTHIVGIAIRPDLLKTQTETTVATEKLMSQARMAVRNDADRYMYRLQDLLLLLQNVKGTLLKYEVKNGTVTWEALIPQAVGGENLQALNARAIGSAPDGRVKIQGNR